ncbi:MAG: FAD-binding protein [Deltaproteobacteria bacterium]|nr:FAD-binding protein [Deltaproteobacteria bacterium]
MPLTKDAVSSLKKICKDRCFTDPEFLILYGYDATRISRQPDAVVFPLSTQETADVLKLANKLAIPVVPRGAGTGLSGGAVPVKGGIVVSTEKMNRILSINKPDLTVEVEPGVITGTLKKMLESQGLFYPPDPASSEFSSIGGNIAENAGGLKAIKYGSTSNYVLGMEVVVPAGEVLWLGRYTHKGVVGYNLKDLFIGSEGTLGIITKAVLKLIPKPQSRSTLFATYPDVGASASIVTDILGTGILPSAIEFMDQASMHAVSSYLGSDVFGSKAGSALLIEVDGEQEATKSAIERIASVCKERALSIETAHGPDAEALWIARRALSPALAKIKPFKLNEDIVVPLSKLPGLVSGVERICAPLNLQYANFGHAGDGNIHVNILYDTKDEGEYKRALIAVDQVFDLVIKLHGTLSGEHGVGITKLSYITKELSPASHKLMQDIKRLIDPNNIMNPGKAI